MSADAVDEAFSHVRMGAALAAAATSRVSTVWIFIIVVEKGGWSLQSWRSNVVTIRYSGAQGREGGVCVLYSLPFKSVCLAGRWLRTIHAFNLCPRLIANHTLDLWIRRLVQRLVTSPCVKVANPPGLITPVCYAAIA
jgi:hypothetical protein